MYAINSRSSFETALKLRSAAVLQSENSCFPIATAAKLRGQMLCAFDSDIWSVKTTPAVISKRPEPRSTPPLPPSPRPRMEFNTKQFVLEIYALLNYM